MYVKSLQLCLTLWDPMDCSPPGSSVQGILQERILKWVTISFSRGSSPSRDWTFVSCISCFSRTACIDSPGSLPLAPPGKVNTNICIINFIIIRFCSNPSTSCFFSCCLLTCLSCVKGYKLDKLKICHLRPTWSSLTQRTNEPTEQTRSIYCSVTKPQETAFSLLCLRTHPRKTCQMTEFPFALSDLGCSFPWNPYPLIPTEKFWRLHLMFWWLSHF